VFTHTPDDLYAPQFAQKLQQAMRQSASEFPNNKLDQINFSAGEKQQAANAQMSLF
jgi:hypothetical protein